nr:retrovirus-related Pol polyprotein from transposon TNT 1-94 [Tanacetum cinerariifolium]
DDYSRYTWVHFLRSKDEAPAVIITFLKRITILLQSPVIIIRTDNGTEFKNQVLKFYFDSVGISHQMSYVQTPKQNGVVERRNWTLVEAARTMLIFSRAPLFLWAEAIATACFTQNRSIIHRRFNKTPYELINGRKPDILFLHEFNALCYPKNDREDIGKLGAKGDIGFFIRYSADSCAYRINNRQTKKIIETMNVSFDELSAMAFEQRSSKPRLQSMTSGQISSMRIASINGKRYILVIVDDYSRYTWVYFLRSKDEAPKVIITFLKRITVIATACFTQNRSIIYRHFNKTPYELINGRKPDISFLNVFGALCYPKNDREDIGKFGAKGDIEFFIPYSADSCAYRVYNQRSKKIMETMNVSFDELSAMAFEQRSSKPGLQSELDLLFEAMYDDYFGGQSSATVENVSLVQEPQDVDELNSNAIVDGNTFVNPFAISSISAAQASSSSQNVDSSNMHTFYQPYPHEFQ